VEIASTISRSHLHPQRGRLSRIVVTKSFFGVGDQGVVLNQQVNELNPKSFEESLAIAELVDAIVDCFNILFEQLMQLA
jgi:hypothetical protein